MNKGLMHSAVMVFPSLLSLSFAPAIWAGSSGPPSSPPSTSGKKDQKSTSIEQSKRTDLISRYKQLLQRKPTQAWAFTKLLRIHLESNKVQDLISARADVDKAPKDKLAQARLTLIEGFQDPTEADLKKMKKATRVKGLDSELVERFAGFKARHPVLLVEAEHHEYVTRAPSRPIQSYQDYLRFEGEQRKRGKIADVEAGEKVYKLYRKKKLRITDSDDTLHWRFWRWAFIGARKAGDKRTAKRIFAYMEEHFESDSALRAEVMGFRAQLDDMK